MKQLLFLLLFPCFAMAQYTGNAGQKITLGEQTTADGLVYRGVASADTTRKPSIDTMAFILLDTTTNILWQYKKATNNAWTRLGGSISSGVTGVLPVVNGGTNTSTAFTAGSVVFAGASGTYAQDNANLFFDNTNKRLGIGTASPNYKLDISGTVNTSLLALRSSTSPSSNDFVGIDFGTGNSNGSLPNRSSRILGFADGANDAIGLSFYTSNGAAPTEKMRITSSGNVGIGTQSPTQKLHVVGTSSAIVKIEATSTNGEPSFQLFGKNSSGTERSFIFKYDNTEVFRLGTAQNVPMRFETNDNIRLFIKGTGEVGIGTESPAVQFHTTSNVRFAGLASITDLRTDADGDLFNGSDFNLKNSIDTINFGLLDVMKLKPVSFNWNNEARNINEYKSMGFIAQDVMNVIPNAASTMGDGDMQVDYNAIVAALTKAIQEQQALIKALEQRILTLENK